MTRLRWIFATLALALLAGLPTSAMGQDLTMVWEFKVKAEMLCGLEVDGSLPSALLSRTLPELVAMSETARVALSGQPSVRTARLPADLRRVQMAMDETVFSEVRLREFATDRPGTAAHNRKLGQ